MAACVIVDKDSIKAIQMDFDWHKYLKSDFRILRFFMCGDGDRLIPCGIYIGKCMNLCRMQILTISILIGHTRLNTIQFKT